MVPAVDYDEYGTTVSVVHVISTIQPYGTTIPYQTALQNIWQLRTNAIVVPE